MQTIDKGDAAVVASKIVKEILIYRRRLDHSNGHGAEEDNEVFSVQLPRVLDLVEKGEPVQFVLPAFPTKSPNPAKVLGTLPDMAERLSLTFLESFCQRIQLIYSPGAHITICSDGHVFSDLIHVADDVVDKYQKAVEDMVVSIGATHLSTYSLRDVSDFSRHSGDYNAQRDLLVRHYAQSEEEIKAVLTADDKGLQLYRNISRFLYEDSLFPGHEESKTTLQKDAKRRAVGVVQRSWAWGNLLNTVFPSAIRLSIHPQPTDSIKVGIHMLPTKDDWLTPWHGVAANLNGNFVLMKHAEAQRLNGELVMVQGVPSHYVINT